MKWPFTLIWITCICALNIDTGTLRYSISLIILRILMYFLLHLIYFIYSFMWSHSYSWIPSRHIIRTMLKWVLNTFIDNAICAHFCVSKFLKCVWIICYTCQVVLVLPIHECHSIFIEILMMWFIRWYQRCSQFLLVHAFTLFIQSRSECVLYFALFATWLVISICRKYDKFLMQLFNVFSLHEMSIVTLIKA